MSPKLLLCADLHLGRSSAWIDGPGEVDRTAMGAWRRIVDHAIAGQATAVVIAGDVFDSKEAYYETRLAFREGLARLKGQGIAAVAVAGNHDWDSLPAFARQFPNDLVLLGSGGRWDLHSAGGASFIGWSFPTATFGGCAFDTFTRPIGSEPLIGIVHGDTSATSPYHPISPLNVAQHADAWVLGHIHKPGKIGSLACYPGSPQALDFGPGELGVHGYTWLTFESGRPCFSETVPISTILFHDWRPDKIDVQTGEDPSEALERAARDVCDELVRAHPGIESVQLRIRAMLSGGKTKPAALPTSPDPRYCWHFVDLWLRDDRDPWIEAAGADAAAEVARLLIGLKAENGMHEGRAVNPDWIESAESLVDAAARDAEIYWRKTVGAAIDHYGEETLSAPTHEEALAIGRRAVEGELWEMLLNSESRTEVTA